MTLNEHRTRPALAEARRLLRARKGRPTEADRPLRPSTPPRVLDGQIDIFGHVHGGHVQPELDAAVETSESDEKIEPAA